MNTFAYCMTTLMFILKRGIAIKMGTYPLIVSVWIQPSIHIFNNITPKKRSLKKN